MRIDDTLTTQTQIRSPGADRVSQTPAVGPGRIREAPQGTEDAVSLSSLGAQLAERLQQESPEEVARVAEVQELFQAGKSPVAAAELAESLIDSSLEETGLEQAIQALGGEQ